MTLAPTYEALSVKPAENLYVGKKTAEFLGSGQECKDDCYHRWSVMLLRVWRCYTPTIWYVVGYADSMITCVISAGLYVDGKVPWPVVCVDTIYSLVL